MRVPAPPPAAGASPGASTFRGHCGAVEGGLLFLFDGSGAGGVVAVRWCPWRGVRVCARTRGGAGETLRISCRSVGAKGGGGGFVSATIPHSAWIRHSCRSLRDGRIVEVALSGIFTEPVARTYVAHRVVSGPRAIWKGNVGSG